MEEEWRIIEDYENYSISNLGRVKNNNTGKILRSAMASGYEFVNLSKNTIKKACLVHRLVCCAFVFNRDPIKYTLVDHIDQNKLNNSSNNLRWVNKSQNRFNIKVNGGIVYNKSYEGYIARFSIFDETIQKSKRISFSSKDKALCEAKLLEWREEYGCRVINFN